MRAAADRHAAGIVAHQPSVALKDREIAGRAVRAGIDVVAPRRGQGDGAGWRRDLIGLLGIKTPQAEIYGALRDVDLNHLVIELLHVDLGRAIEPYQAVTELQGCARPRLGPERETLGHGIIDDRGLPFLRIESVEGHGAVDIAEPPDPGRRIDRVVGLRCAARHGRQACLSHCGRYRQREQHRHNARRCERATEPQRVVEIHGELSDHL